MTPWDGQREKISELRSMQEWLSFDVLIRQSREGQGRAGQNTFGQSRAGQGKAWTGMGRARALASLTPHLQSVPSSVGRHFLMLMRTLR